MKSIFIFVFNILFMSVSIAQTSAKLAVKPALDFSVLGKWPYVEFPKLSNDGKYVFYTYKEGDKETLIIKATEGSWEKRIVGVGSFNAVITENSKFLIAKKDDRLLIVPLSKSYIETITNIASYKTPNEGSGEWLAYRLKNDDKELVLRNLNNGKELRYAAVNEYMFSKEGNLLMLILEEERDKRKMQLVYPINGNSEIVWQGSSVDNICFDNAGNQMAFIAADPENGFKNALWFYRRQMDKAIVVVGDKSDGIKEGLSISNNQVRFNIRGSRLFFYLESPPIPNPNRDYISVDVWSYLDEKLQSEQLQSKSVEKYLAAISVDNNVKSNKENRVVQIEQEGDEVNGSIEKMIAEYVLVNNTKGNASESYWNPVAFNSVYLVSTFDGSRQLLKKNICYHSNLHTLLPDEKFVISFDGKLNCFFSYEIATGITRNISKDIPCSLNSNLQEYADSYSHPYFLGMSTVDQNVLIYDEYDIWQIDPRAIKGAINLTNGYGRKNDIVFRMLDQDGMLNNSFGKRNNVLITAFNKKNKNNGFYSITVGVQKDPELLSMGPLVSYTTAIPGGVVNVFKPLKAKHSSIFLISRMKSTEAPNYFITKNFRQFTPISFVPSPKLYNWYTTELIEWHMFDGTKSQGILYKPESFDPQKKYPIIFVYYEWKSDKLNEFIYPKFTEAELNIPYFVSNDYVVCTPDIHYKIGHTGESAYNSIVSAAQYLGKFNWVDSTKIGIAGHSFGGYETNYLVTHSDHFAAAVSAAGTSDFISGYGSLRGDGTGRHWIYENTQSRIGATLWDASELYIKNSPIFNAHKVTTPLLLMNNKNDNAVPFSQGVELFTALRRLGKRAWMLQYDNGGHDVGGAEAEDFTKRIHQFFDHYLKGKPAPKWMTRGIPATHKGVDDGFELDGEVQTPRKILTKE